MSILLIRAKTYGVRFASASRRWESGPNIHHERYRQNEIDFKFSDAVNSADNLITFKQVVKSIAQGTGFASFARTAARQSGSGLHIIFTDAEQAQRVQAG